MIFADAEHLGDNWILESGSSQESNLSVLILKPLNCY